MNSYPIVGCRILMHEHERFHLCPDVDCPPETFVIEFSGPVITFDAGIRRIAVHNRLGINGTVAIVLPFEDDVPDVCCLASDSALTFGKIVTSCCPRSVGLRRMLPSLSGLMVDCL